MDQHTLKKLFDYHYWANHRLWRSVMMLNEEQFTQPLGHETPSIRTQLFRMVVNENLWVNYLWHGEIEFLQECHFPTRSSIRLEWDALEEEIHDFIDQLSPFALESRVTAPFLNNSASPCLWEALLQMVNYGIEARAQVRLHLHQLGTPAPGQDFFDFLVDLQNPLPVSAAWALTRIRESHPSYSV